MYIGIDLGTSSVKLLLMNQDKQILKTVVKEYELIFPKPLWSEQRPQDWWNAVQVGIRELVSGFNNKIKAISFSGQMHGMVALNKYGEVIRPAILWNDQRTKKQCDYLNDIVGQEKLSKWVYNKALTGFTAPKVLWLKEEEPENFKQIYKILLPKDYIAYKLTGVYATDVSDASGTLYFDIKNKKWSNEMLEILEINEAQLPCVYESNEIIGKILPEIAKEIELNEDVKIIIGGGDQAVSAVGTGTVEDGACTISLGTSGVIFVATENFKTDDQNALHSFAHANGKYHLMGVILSAASSLKWWVENILDSTHEKVMEEVPNTSIDDSIFFLPYLMGERTPINDPRAKGMFIGMAMHHHQKHMTRAVLEGVSFAIRDSFEIMKKMGLTIQEANICGGGSKSSIWKQILADVLNIEIHTVQADEGPAFGAALIAMGGDLSININELSNKSAEHIETFKPNLKNIHKYNEKYNEFKSLYPAVKKIFNSN